jgi:hypothetical protein
MLDDMVTISQRWPSFGVSTGDTERPPSSCVCLPMQQVATPRVASWATAQLRLLGWCHIHCMLPSFLAVIKTHHPHLRVAFFRSTPACCRRRWRPDVDEWRGRCLLGCCRCGTERICVHHASHRAWADSSRPRGRRDHSAHVSSRKRMLHV